MPIRTLLAGVLSLFAMISAPKAEQLHVLAAGSLREVLSEIGNQYRKTTGVEMSADFGPSGVLRQRIEQGERADLFASADIGHPLKLLAEGRATRVAMFTRNRLCAMAVPKVGLTSANFTDRLLDPTVKLGTSTAKGRSGRRLHLGDVSQDRRIASKQFRYPRQKGATNRRRPNQQRQCRRQGPVVAAFAERRVDLFVGYCSGAKRLLAQLPQLQVAEVPRELAAGPEYGLAVLKGSDPRTPDFALFVLSPSGQQIFADYGFAPVALPAPGH